ncbi:hypothetical protein [Luteibacter rhizovicinus]|nr:hypothetical protein [Luteibacter rhizovicinus]
MHELAVNFKRMPVFLKLLTLFSVMSVFLVIATIIPGGAVVGQKKVGLGEWWSNGSGIVLAVAIGLFVASGVAILKRLHRSRALYLCSWIILYLAVFIIELINKVSYSSDQYVSDLLFGALQLIVFALYLYFSKGVKNYFFERTPSSSL